MAILFGGAIKKDELQKCYDALTEKRGAGSHPRGIWICRSKSQMNSMCDKEKDYYVCEEEYQYGM